MKQQRDYKAEYARRIERATAKGLSRSQARGHAKVHETPLKIKDPPREKLAGLEAALRRLRRGESLSASARAERISPETFRRFVKGQQLAQREGRKWVLTDHRPRRVSIIVKGDQRAIVVPSFSDASVAGRYWNASGRFVREGDIEILRPFEGKGLTDVKGTFHPFETDPNELFRFALKDEPAFHEIYAIVAT